jgi:hypothetical protein
MHRDAPRFHDNVVINKFPAGVPTGDFLNRPPKRDGQFFVAGLKRAIAKVAQNPRSFFLARAAVINDVIRQVSSRESVGPPTQSF